jgi:hypothetical protein
MEAESTLPCPHEPAIIPTRSRINPVHALPLYFFMVSFNIILTSTPKCRNFSHPSGAPPNLFALLFPPKNLPSVPSFLSPSIWSSDMCSTSLNVPFILLSPVSCYFLPRRSKYIPQYPVLEPSHMFFS